MPGQLQQECVSGGRLGMIAAVIGSVCGPYLEQMERVRDTDHCDDQRRGELRLGAQPGQRPGDRECQEETNGGPWLRPGSASNTGESS